MLHAILQVDLSDFLSVAGGGLEALVDILLPFVLVGLGRVLHRHFPR